MDKAIRLLVVPYDSGHYNARMGAGPLTLTRAGAADRLRDQGHVVEEQVLEPQSKWHAELKTAFELQRVIAAAVSGARGAGQIPLLLAGNCNATVGVLAGMAGPERLGLVWLDAHGDFNTPETDGGGFLDGQALAMAVGRCWESVTATVPGFESLTEQGVLLAGARCLDDAEERALRRSAVAWLPPAQVREPGALAMAVALMAQHVDAVHLHVDLDVHDPSIAPANGYAAPDGLFVDDVSEIIRQTANHLPIVSATLASYDPAYDRDWRMRDTALDLLELLARNASKAAGTVAARRDARAAESDGLENR